MIRETILLFILFQWQTYRHKNVEEGRQLVYTDHYNCFHMFFFLVIFTIEFFMKLETYGNV